MLKRIIKSILLATTFMTFSIYAQQAAEIFIPIGKSPGISNQHSIIGKIKTADAKNGTFTMLDNNSEYTVKLTSSTKIWKDYSKLKKTNQMGTREDCQPDRFVEVSYTDDKKNRKVTAKWVKIEMTD